MDLKTANIANIIGQGNQSNKNGSNSLNSLNKLTRFLKKSLNNTGFSLIELLVVIGIMVVITGIAIPQFNGILVNAKKNNDIINASTIATVVTRGIIEEKISVPDYGRINDVTMKDLVDAGYLQNEIKPRYMKGEFIAKVLSDGKIEVFIYESVSSSEMKLMSGDLSGNGNEIKLFPETDPPYVD